MAQIPGSGGSSTQFEPVPDGVYVAVLAEVQRVEGEYMGKPNTQGCFIFQTPAVVDDQGIPKEVRYFCGWTMGRKPDGGPTKMRAFLQEWRGAEISDAEAATLDLDKLVGVPSVIETRLEASKTNPDRWRAAIQRIRRAAPNEAAGAALRGYVPMAQRRRQTTQQTAPVAAPAAPASFTPGADDIPF